MGIVFKGKARYPSMSDGYALYLRRTKKPETELDEKTYGKVIKAYCKTLAELLENDGIVDLPCKLGSIVVTRYKYRWKFTNDGKIHGRGKTDWAKTRELWNNDPKAAENKVRVMSPDLYGTVIAYVPNHYTANGNLRAVGFRANRELYRRIAESVKNGTNNYAVPDYDNFML